MHRKLVRRRELWIARQLALASALALACSGPTGLEGNLDEARARWDRAGITSYDFTLQRTCFCSTEFTRPIVISVRNGVVTNRHYADTGQPIPASFENVFSTIDNLFDEVQSAIDNDVAQLKATYDDQLGFPLSVYIDVDANAADDEHGFSVSNFTAR